jgi:hypothetical protein
VKQTYEIVYELTVVQIYVHAYGPSIKFCMKIQDEGMP